MKTAEEIKKENQDRSLAQAIFVQYMLSALADSCFEEFRDEKNSLEKKIHALWRESGRGDAPTYDLGVWAQEVIEFEEAFWQLRQPKTKKSGN